MSYQVIARKWRPQTFEEVTGQEVITKTLRNALEFDRLHHAYLFSGARGVGKTTTARIFAKALNCHKTTDKPNLTPCLLNDPTACPSCIEISESRSMDVLEIDAASHTGIDDVRGTIIDSINFNPARDRYKVFIIDEVHQLSKPAFNALLKTLEEPPEKVVFIMATTEYHKVPITITSRCQEFEFRTIAIQKIFDRLKLIAEAEKIDVTDEALRELARSGEGSMRDAQSNFDQVISFSGDKIEAQDVTNALGFAGVEILTKTINAITARDPRAALNVVDDLISRGHDLRNFCRDLLGLIRDLLVFKVANSDKQLFEAAVFSEEDLKRMAESFSEADLLRFFNSLCETETALRDAMHPRYVLEIGLVKLIEMRKVATLESIIERLNAVAGGDPLPTASAAAATVEPIAEKKTLNAEKPVISEPKTPPIEPVSFPDTPSIAPVSENIPPEPPDNFDEPPISFSDFDRPVFDESPFDDDRFAAYDPPKGFDEMPVRLLSLSSEELEHFDDDKLDGEYERKLKWSGDDLLPIATRESMMTQILGVRAATAVAATNGSSTAAAVVPAFDAAKLRAEIEPELEDVEIPILGDDPTREELTAYAKAHPEVRTAMRVFRAKIVDVKKI